MIVEAGRSLITSGDFRLWKIVSGKELIAGALFARAGDASEALLPRLTQRGAHLGPALAHSSPRLGASSTPAPG